MLCTFLGYSLLLLAVPQQSDVQAAYDAFSALPTVYYF